MEEISIVVKEVVVFAEADADPDLAFRIQEQQLKGLTTLDLSTKYNYRFIIILI